VAPTVELWHQRLGHPGAPALSQVLSTFDFSCNKSEDHSCESCHLGKHVHLPFNTSETQTFSLFNLFTRMFGHPQFLAIQVSNTMLCSWMISLIIFGPSRFVLSLKFFHLFDPFMLTCKLSSVYQLLRSKLTTAANSTLLPRAPSSPTTASPSASLARIRPSRTARRNALYARLTIVCEPC
jgi:hypothetical protein